MSEIAKTAEKPKRQTVKSLKVQLERAVSDREAADVLRKRAEKHADDCQAQLRAAKNMATAFRQLQIDWHQSMENGREKYLDAELGRARESLAAADQKLAAKEKAAESITVYMLKNNELTREADRLRAELTAVEATLRTRSAELATVTAERDRLLKQNDNQAQTISDLMGELAEPLAVVLRVNRR